MLPQPLFGSVISVYACTFTRRRRNDGMSRTTSRKTSVGLLTN